MTHRPPWCGRCDQRTRQLLLPDDRAARCPRCHPLLAAANPTDPADRPRRPLPSAGGYLATVDDRAAAAERAAADAVVAAFAASGQPFSANDLRPHFDLADVSRALRGSRVAAALAAGVIVETGTTRSTDPGTHGKRIGVYRGAAPSSAPLPNPPTAQRIPPQAATATPRPAAAVRCDSCGHPLNAALAASDDRRHPACTAPARGHTAQRWATEHRPRDLSLPERLALVVLARYADEQPPSWPGRDTLARQSGLPADKLAVALDGLARRGLVQGLHASCSSCRRGLVPVLAVDDTRRPVCPSCGPGTDGST